MSQLVAPAFRFAHSVHLNRLFLSHWQAQLGYQDPVAHKASAYNDLLAARLDVECAQQSGAFLHIAAPFFLPARQGWKTQTYAAYGSATLPVFAAHATS